MLRLLFAFFRWFWEQADPVRFASQACIVTGVVWLLLGGVLLSGRLHAPDDVELLIIGIALATEGLVYVGLGIGIHKESLACAWIASILFTLGTLVSFGGLSSGGAGGTCFVVLRGFLAVALWRSLLEIQRLRSLDDVRDHRIREFEAEQIRRETHRFTGPLRGVRRSSGRPSDRLEPNPEPVPSEPEPPSPAGERLAPSSVIGSGSGGGWAKPDGEPEQPPAEPAEAPSDPAEELVFGPPMRCPNCGGNYPSGTERCPSDGVVLFEDA